MNFHNIQDNDDLHDTIQALENELVTIRIEKEELERQVDRIRAASE